MATTLPSGLHSVFGLIYAGGGCDLLRSVNGVRCSSVNEVGCCHKHDCASVNGVRCSHTGMCQWIWLALPYTSTSSSRCHM